MPLLDPFSDSWAFRMPDQLSRYSSFNFNASSFYFHFPPPEHVSSQLERIFSEFLHYQRWIIAEPSLTRDGRHGVATAIDGGPLECHDHR